MASITSRTSKDGNSSHTVRVRLKGHPPQSATFSRLTDARKWSQQTEAAIREGRYFKTREAQRRTVTDLLARYEGEVAANPKMVRAGRLKHIAWWKAQIGHLVLAEVTPAVVSEQRDHLRAEVTKRGVHRSAATTNRYLATFSHALGLAAKEWGWLEDNPLRNVRRAPKPGGRVRFLSDSF